MSDFINSDNESRDIMGNIEKMGYNARKNIIKAIGESLRESELIDGDNVAADEMIYFLASEAGLMTDNTKRNSFPSSIRTPFKAFRFVAKILSIESENEEKSNCVHISKFEKAIGRFPGFSDEIHLPRTVELYEKLNQINKHFTETVLFHDLQGKVKVALAGGFSSGKSTFINSLVQDRKLLPKGVKETSTVPTYIVGGETNQYQILNRNNQIVANSRDDFQAIQYDFEDVYKMRLIELIKYAVVTVPNFPFENLVLMDTPGFNTKDSQDDKIAKNALNDAEAVIWITMKTVIPPADLQILKTMSEKGKEILVVFNFKQKSDIPSALESIQQNLNNEGVHYLSVVSYNALTGKEYTVEINGQIQEVTDKKEGVIFSFLSEQNEKIPDFASIRDELWEVGDPIKTHILDRINHQKEKTSKYADLESVIKQSSSQIQPSSIRGRIIQLISSEKDELIKEQNNLDEKFEEFERVVKTLTEILDDAGIQDSLKGKLKIVKAKYGCDDSWIDVKQILIEQIKDASLDIQITNESMEKDPAAGKWKSQKVQYRADGQQKEVEVSEGETLSLSLNDAAVFFVNHFNDLVFVENNEGDLANMTIPQTPKKDNAEAYRNIRDLLESCIK